MFTKLSTPEFETEGAQLFQGALLSCLDDLISALEEVPTTDAGVRLNGVTTLRPFLASNEPIGAIAADLSPDWSVI
jgi:hypothetical protein